MPVNIPARDNAGMSNGVFHLLNRGMAPDFAIIMKPWNWVYHEEPGMGWFRITVKGTLGYAGVPRGLPISAARWFRRCRHHRARTMADRLCRGQYLRARSSPTAGSRGCAGVWNVPTFPTAATEILCDVRINPRTSPGNVKAQFAAFIAGFRAAHPDIDAVGRWSDRPGGTTDPENWIIPVRPARLGTCRRARLSRTRPPRRSDRRRRAAPSGRSHRPHRPWPASGSPEPVAEGLGGMGATYVPDLIPCARKIAYAVIDTLTRPREDLGL
jgi:hypothetical protein